MNSEKSISRKALEIIKCIQCHYMERYPLIDPPIPGKCNGPGMEDHPTLILNVHDYIPEWCPLEDWPDE
jgi:hypothetical protein